MWSILFKGIKEIFTSWIGLKKAKHESEALRMQRLAQTEADWDLEAMRNSKYSWKDEFIMLIWYSPLIIGWWDATDKSLVSAVDWISFVSNLPYWWQFGAFGIMAASFGLRWYMKQQNFQVGKK